MKAIREKIFFRDCPECSRELGYTLEKVRNRAIKDGRLCSSCAQMGSRNGFYGKNHDDATRATMSEARNLREAQMTPEDKAEFRITMQQVWTDHHEGKVRKSNFDYWVDKHGLERANELLDDFRAKTSVANQGSKNAMYGRSVPPKAGNGWQGWYREEFFRSLRELSFMVNNPTAISAENVTWRSPYVNYDGGERTTVPDFVIEDQKMVIECKPKNLWDSPAVILRRVAIEKRAAELGYVFQMVDPEILPVSLMTSMIESGEVVLTEKTKEKWATWQEKS